MLFAKLSFDVSTKINKNAPDVLTRVTLTESDISADVLQNALLSGNSPRVRLQMKFRADGIPSVYETSWAQYLTGKTARVIVPMTVDQIAATTSKEDKAKLLAMLLAEQADEITQTDIEQSDEQSEE